MAGQVSPPTCGTQNWGNIVKPGPSVIAQGVCTNGGREWSAGSQVRGRVIAALVRLSGPVSAGQIPSSVIASLRPTGGQGSNTGYNFNTAQGTWQPIRFMLNGAVNVVPTTCTTSDVSVNMGTVAGSHFKGVGTTAAKQSFSLSLNNCPSGINSVSYRIDPVNAIVDSGNAVMALNSGGATGVGIQLLDSTGKPLKLQTAIPFTGYKTSGGNFSIPLQAAYYQTNSTINNGTANSAATFTFTYQ